MAIHPALLTSFPSPRLVDSLYMVGYNAVLYKVDVTTGIATRVGSATQFGVNEPFPGALTYHNGKMLMSGLDRQMFQIRPPNGDRY